ncbi:YjbH domain-containing protein [Emticicia sp. BO119]|uniref:YjbH domain-containing protein n=1 Tax=Emticicia sp. BO119 TaxID=2757768 RepID=UPI0015F10C1A|nr:YjbH domain-containing protein [Emticicia sp. BO119]MBA4850536.1 YjbH domain-containing protein [Emticicia sp. BO119]
MIDKGILSLILLSKRTKDRIFSLELFIKLFKHYFLYIFICSSVNAQMNLSGKSGLLYIPNSTAYRDGSLSFGYNYNPIKYSLRNKNTNPEQVIFASITLLPRLTLTLSLLQPVQTKKSKLREGLGDRQVDISYLLIKEKPKFPSLAIIISSPFMIETAMLTNVLVATKHFKLSSLLDLETTVGYGSPYIVSREGNFQLNTANSNIFSNLKFQKKSDFVFNNGYLVGPFGGLKLSFQNKAGLMAEWDSQHLNVGMYATLWKKWTIQGGLLNGDQFMFGSSFNIQLLKPKKSITKIDEKVY